MGRRSAGAVTAAMALTAALAWAGPAGAHDHHPHGGLAVQVLVEEVAHGWDGAGHHDAPGGHGHRWRHVYRHGYRHVYRHGWREWHHGGWSLLHGVWFSPPHGGHH